MSASHHSEAEIAAQQRLLDQFLHRAKPNFPAGRIHADDQGELSFAVAANPKTKTVIIHFGKPVDWIGFGANEARTLAKLLLEKADQLEAAQ